MSSIQTFIKKYSTELDQKLDEIDRLDISSIKKLDMIQAAKEEEKNNRIPIFKVEPMEDTYMDELIEGWGRGSDRHLYG